MDDIVSAAKFLQIEGAKDFILPKPQSQQQSSHQSSTAAKMQIDLHSKTNQKSLITQQQQQTQQTAQQKTMSLLSKMVQKPPINMRSIASDSESMPIISSVRHINERELEKVIKVEDNDEEDEEEDDDDCRIENDLTVVKKSTNSDPQQKNEKSGMFAEFEEQGINNKNFNNESKLDTSNDDNEEPMDTSIMGSILAKVPAGTSVRTTLIGDNAIQQQSDDIKGIFHLFFN